MIYAYIALLLSISVGVLADETTSIFLPIADQQTLLASVIQTSGDVKTMVVNCPSGADSNDCGFPTPVTITAGPSTVGFSLAMESVPTIVLNCEVQGTTAGACTQTFTGAASSSDAMLTGTDGEKTVTWTTSVTLEPSDVSFIAVTITAGPTATETGSASSSTSGSSNSGSGGSGSGSGSGSQTSSSSQNHAALPTGMGPVMAFGVMANLVLAY